jgi:hypothetical protein
MAYWILQANPAQYRLLEATANRGKGIGAIWAFGGRSRDLVGILARSRSQTVGQPASAPWRDLQSFGTRVQPDPTRRARR